MFGFFTCSEGERKAGGKEAMTDPGGLPTRTETKLPRGLDTWIQESCARILSITHAGQGTHFLLLMPEN